MILNIRQFILILSVLVFAACEPSDERIEITETLELGDFNPKPKLNLGFRDRVGIEEKKPEGSPLNNVSFFVKLTGPKAIVDAEMDNFNLFCDSLKIGEGNTFREGCSIHKGTNGGGGETIIGDNNLFMGYVHIAHDCKLGNNNILSNYTGLSGHVIIENNVILGGQNGVCLLYTSDAADE